MESPLTNLLPFARRELLRRNYRIRVAVLAMTLLAALFVFFVLLLYPSHVRVAQLEEKARLQLVQAEESIKASGDRTLLARMEALGRNANALLARGETVSASEFLRGILSVHREGIRLTVIQYSAENTAIVLRGVAQSRDVLRAYQGALQKVPDVIRADVPVSVYAYSADIPFVITLVLRP